MEVDRFETRPITLLGLGFFGNPFEVSGGWTEENEIGRLWSRFMAYLERHGQEIRQASTMDVAFELHIEHDETRQTGEYEVFVGLEVEGLEEVPVQLSAKVLPPTTYAVFVLRGQEIVSDWGQEIHGQWMPGSGYESAGSWGLQRYDERFKGLDRLDESLIEVYVPVRRAGA
ncbi:MAG: GyrI-like domain-containing protein [Anaerolineae bacterium]|jgi:predicted transcriptional regulator YdeE